MSLIAIGDIHGCAQTLDALLRVLAPGQNEHLVFLGDYVDRGPDSCGVIERLLKLEQTHNCTFLRGNHDDYLLEWCETGAYEDWHLFGGDRTLESYRHPSGAVDIPEFHVDFLRRTRFFLDTPNYLFVHGGVDPNLTVAQNLTVPDLRALMYCRKHLQARTVVWEKCVVFGHTPMPEPIVTPRMIGLDTGCVFGEKRGLGRLTAIRLPRNEIVCVTNCDLENEASS